MKALIHLTQPVSHVIAWDGKKPVMELYANSARVCDVAQQEFEVAPEELIWVDCADNVMADYYWYDTVAKTVNPIVNEPYDFTQNT